MGFYRRRGIRRRGFGRAPCRTATIKWNYAADKYRADHPAFGALPPGPARLLPVAEADRRMAAWMPWAIARIRAGFDRLAAMFPTLTAEQLAAVDAEPEAAADDAA
jgi:hypothetical protein